MTEFGASFADNLKLLPSIEGVERLNISSADGTVIASIENEPGKQGSLAVYQYLAQTFGMLDAAAAQRGLEVFGEHTLDARARHGAHPNIDRLIGIIESGSVLQIAVVTRPRT